MGEETVSVAAVQDKDPANVVLSVKEKIMYSCGGFADNTIMGLYGSYAQFFFTDILGITQTFVATLMLVSRFWDAINDPIIGVLCDRTDTKIGRYRPWMLYGIVPLMLGTVMIFITVPGASVDVQKWYSLFAYFMFFLWYTIYDIPYSAAAAVVTTNYQSRGSLGSYRLGFGNIGNWVSSTFFLYLVPIFGGDNLNKGYFWSALFLTCCTLPFFLVAYKGTVERVPSKKGDTPPLKECMKILKGNSPLLWICLAHICWGIHGAGLGYRIYFFTYVYGNTLAFATHVSMYVAGMSCGPVFNNFMMKHTKNKRTPGMICWAVAGTIEILTYFMTVTDANVFFYNILFMIVGMCGFCGLNAIFACYPDLTEYSKAKYGINATAFLFSYVNFTFKTGGALMRAFFGYLLGWLGYVAGQAQSPAILAIMKSTISLYVGGCLIAGSFFLSRYKIDEQTFNQLRAEAQK